MVELSQQAQSLLPKNDFNSRCLISTNLGIAYWHSGYMDAAESALIEALDTARATRNHYVESTALVFQGMVMAVRGKLRDAAERFQLITQQDDHPSFIRGLAYLYLSVLHYEWNDLEKSGNHLLEAAQIGERSRNDELLVSSQMVMARIHMSAGNLSAARDVLDKAHQRAIEGDVPATAIPRLAAIQVKVALANDDLAAALSWAEHLVDDCDCQTFYRFTNTTQALLFLTLNKKTMRLRIWLNLIRWLHKGDGGMA
jgi:LuxR family maltose regulon positive regulatory protein